MNDIKRTSHYTKGLCYEEYEKQFYKKEMLDLEVSQL
jgi:hypothetical protein